MPPKQPKENAPDHNKPPSQAELRAVADVEKAKVAAAVDNPSRSPDEQHAFAETFNANAYTSDDDREQGVSLFLQNAEDDELASPSRVVYARFDYRNQDEPDVLHRKIFTLDQNDRGQLQLSVTDGRFFGDQDTTPDYDHSYMPDVANMTPAQAIVAFALRDIDSVVDDNPNGTVEDVDLLAKIVVCAEQHP